MKKLDDYENTFKYELGGETGGNYLIYSGKGGDKFYLMTPSIAFFNFKKEADALAFCNKLNAIADKAQHTNK
jgi:hypothetical protein